jgi:hypothetical protein
MNNDTFHFGNQQEILTFFYPPDSLYRSCHAGGYPRSGFRDGSARAELPRSASKGVWRSQTVAPSGIVRSKEGSSAAVFLQSSHKIVILSEAPHTYLPRDTALDGAESKDPEDAHFVRAVRSFSTKSLCVTSLRDKGTPLDAIPIPGNRRNKYAIRAPSKLGTDRAWLDPSLAGESFWEHKLAPANCRHRQL